MTPSTEPTRAAKPPLLSWKRRIVIYPCLIAGGYLAWLIVLYSQQDRMLFPGAYSLRSAGAAVPHGFEQVWLTLNDGSRVECWYFPGAGRTPQRPGPAVIFTHGNAESIADWVEGARAYGFQGISVLLVEYPGYGRSTGRPSEPSITEAMNKGYDWLIARPEVDPKRLVYHGRSIGGAAVAALARTRPPAAMILESAPKSVASFCGRYGAPEFLCRNPFRTDEVVATLQCPMLIFHGTTDQIVPVDHARELHRLAPHSELVEMPAGHNDFPADGDAYWDAISEFLLKSGITARPGAK